MFCTVIVNSKKFNKTASVNCDLMLLQENSPDPHCVDSIHIQTKFTFVSCIKNKIPTYNKYFA